MKELKANGEKMEAREFFKEKERMCDWLGSCTDCGLAPINNKTGEHCGSFTLEYPEEAIEIVEKWSEENPKKTNLHKFEEMFPDKPWTKSRSRYYEDCDCARGLFHDTP